MDSVFLLGEGDRSAFLRHMMQSFDCTYICLWSYLPQPTNCLLFLDGVYREVSNLGPSSSSGSLSGRLFNVYCGSVNYIHNGRVPGLAFKNNLPYLELKLHDLQGLASSEVQLQFYQEAGIKTLVFMGCATGEIELGFSNESQVNLEMEMKNWFPLDFSRQVDPNPDQTRPTSSSSSLRSLSFDSPEYSPLLYTIPSTSLLQEPQKEPLNDQEPLIKSNPMVAPIIPSPQQQDTRQFRNIRFPTIESDDDAMTKAILAVLSNPSSTSPSSSQNLPPMSPLSRKSTSFQSYRMGLGPVIGGVNRKQNMFKRALSFFQNLNMRRRQELRIQENRPTVTQMHHMISERKRREKLNESFQILRSLLPQGSKKDKASVLSNTTQYLSSLKSQVEELIERNRILEEQVSKQREFNEQVVGSSSSERLSVEINQLDSESTSESRILDLRVTVRGECSMLDLVARLLEFLKKQNNVSLLSVESNTRMAESTSVHGVVLRLKIEVDEFDVSGLQEAVKRVVGDLAR